MTKFLVLGASPNSLRFSNKAIRSLLRHNKEVEAVGFRKGTVSGVKIQTGLPLLANIDTVLLYLGAKRQEAYLNYLVNLKPKRVVFNPGTENPKLLKILTENDIEVIDACALVMINAGEL